MKPILNKRKKVDENQLADLDKAILQAYPGAKLSEGIKYARWADITEGGNLQTPDFFDGKYEPDNVFDGKVAGKDKMILMWMPFFD